MAEELPMYTGAVPRMAQQGFANLPSIPKVQSQGAAIDSAIKAGLGIAEDYAELHDFGTRQEVEAKRAENDLARDKEFAERSALANGAEGSFWNEDGTRNEDALAGFAAKWEEKDQEIARPYWLRRNAQRDEEQSRTDWERVRKRVELQAIGEESRRRRQAFDTNLQLAQETKSWDRARSVVDDAFESRQISEVERDLMKVRIGRAQERDRLASVEAAVKANPLAAGELQHEELSRLRAGGAAEVEVGSSRPIAVDAEEKEGVLETLETETCKGALTMSAGGLRLELSGTPSVASQWQSAQVNQGEYTLAQHRQSVMTVAADVYSRPEYAGLSDAQRQKLIVERAGLIGGADMFFDGDAAAYNGWLLQNAAQLEGLAGVVRKTDRMLAGYLGQGGIDALLNDEVTDQEINAVWQDDKLLNEMGPVKISGRNPVAGLSLAASLASMLNKEKLTPAAKAARQELYETYKEKWAKDAKRELEGYDDDAEDFWSWYTKDKGVHEQKRAAFAAGVRNVYRQKAIDSVLKLRADGTYVLRNGTRVTLDGKSDWSVEQRVLRDALQAPLTKQEHGTLAALSEQQVAMKVARDAAAARYAREAKAATADVKNRNDAFRAEKNAAAFSELEKGWQKEADAANKKKAEEMRRKSVYSMLTKGTAVQARWDGRKVDNSAAPKVTMPLEEYNEIARGLDAWEGFFVVLPGRALPVPVEGRAQAKRVEFNRACFPLMKKGRMSEAERRQLVNGAAIKMKFTKDSTSYDF